MTKEDLALRLKSGESMMEMFDFGSGQDCEIFKANSFVPGDDIIYIPDIALNGIHIDRPITDPEELEETLSCCYTGNDFTEECGGNKDMAERLFWYCDWQHPSSALPEIEDD